MKAYELIELLRQNPDADVVVLEGVPDREDCKRKLVTPYFDAEGRFVIQYW